MVVRLKTLEIRSYRFAGCSMLHRAKSRDVYRKYRIDFLSSHSEWEHIELDMQERFGHTNLKKLGDTELDTLAMQYDYYK